MKTTIFTAIAISALLLGACLPGQRLGNFKNDCAAKNGVLKADGPNEYTCTLSDGTVLRSR